jgi:hypothetical protein
MSDEQLTALQNTNMRTVERMDAFESSLQQSHQSTPTPIEEAEATVAAEPSQAITERSADKEFQPISRVGTTSPRISRRFLQFSVTRARTSSLLGGMSKRPADLSREFM